VARWRKLLSRMASDGRPTGYTYEDAAVVLRALGFQVAPSGGGSHRKWRAVSPAGIVVVIGLVEKGAGALKPYLIRDMISQLRQNGFLPADLERGDDLDY
jgi:predicted RNA binding protein YcfA (HicA-like mRNA interferase family)